MFGRELVYHNDTMELYCKLLIIGNPIKEKEACIVSRHDVYRVI